MTGLAWSDVAVAHLLDTTRCPVCDADALTGHRCARCGADYTGAAGAELWDASRAAVSALRERQAALARIPRVPMPAPAGPSPTPVAPALPGAGGPSATVQSVLAVSGAGLVAVAAFVFTFINPDLTDTLLRNIIVAVVTLGFLVAARTLARRGLRFSAEAVGALGMVFLALDVSAFAELSPPSVSPWVFAAIGTTLAGAAMVPLAVRTGIRAWLLLSLVGLSTVPFLLGLADGTAALTGLGAVGAGFAAFALVEATRPLARRIGTTLRTDRITLTVLQVLAVPVTIAAGLSAATPQLAFWLTMSGLLAALAVLAVAATRQLLPRTWSLGAGALGTTAVIALVAAFPPPSMWFGWLLVAQPAAAMLALLLLGVVLPLPRTAVRRLVSGGALAVADVVAVPLAGFTLSAGAATVLDVGELLAPMQVSATTAGLTVIAIGFAGFAGLARVRWAAQLAVWFAVAAVLVFACWPMLPVWGGIAVALGFAVLGALGLTLIPRLRAARAASRLPVTIGVHVALLLGVIVSWREDDLVVAAGVVAVGAIAAVARTIPAGGRFVHVGIGYAYALAVFARGLGLVGLEAVPTLCLTTSLAAVGAIVATFLPLVRARSWWAVLAVTSLPFLAGVVQVVFERSGWTALSTGLIFLLALSLVLTRRPGLGVLLRTTASALLVPSLSVVVVCLGAQLLIDSGSPVVLPVIAAIVALVLPTAGVIRRGLVRRGLAGRDAAAARVALEASALVTGAIAVGLGLVRDAAGLGTTMIVLLIVGAGAGAMALQRTRRYGWWIAGAAFTGALWCAWGLAEVTLPEPYILPPAIAAIVVGAILVARRVVRAVPLYAAGLAIAIVPVLALLAVAGSPATIVWRTYGLLAAAWLLTTAALLVARAPRVRALATPTRAAAVVAAAAGAVQGVRLGIGLDPSAGPMPLVLVCAALSLLGAAPAFLAGRAIATDAASGSRLARTRWLTAPAVLFAAAGTWTAIHRDWFTIWVMWSLLITLLVGVVAVAWRLRSGRTSLPPVWFVFAIAFATAIVAWSPRDLRVEWFSLPLGLALLTAGALHVRCGGEGRRTLDSWPGRFTGSWWLLAPGLIVMLSASMAATFTDPLTWRAILVIVIALLAILAGSGLKLAAPFVIGIVVLPIENALAFLVQIGRGIQSMPWWITLAVVGAVLLIIAVTYERRAAGDAGLVARLRDLA